MFFFQAEDGIRDEPRGERGRGQAPQQGAGHRLRHLPCALPQGTVKRRGGSVTTRLEKPDKMTASAHILGIVAGAMMFIASQAQDRAMADRDQPALEAQIEDLKAKT